MLYYVLTYQLKSMGPGGANVADVVSAEDEELMTKMASVKIETLNSEASQKVAGFYRKLQVTVYYTVCSVYYRTLELCTIL